ncbi:MAG: UDP-N-acetylmuramoyl-L-alanine--D-glutamate ligase [Cyanobacteriota bacterium]|nr:UDP-N-acetylmuramoyl-L-alanine--D-glutamate ligase [Cyanobacteriota bacterium]
MPNACIIGLGRSGMAASRLLKREGWDVILSDRGCSEALQQQQQQLEREEITVKLGDRFVLPDQNLPQLIVVSPGVPWDLPVLVEARDRGIETIGEMELAWQHLKHFPWVGITGTNGKTTTTALTAAIFQGAGLDAPACGNIGYAACELALKEEVGAGLPRPEVGTGLSRPEVGTGLPRSFDWVIAEISSYQIESSAQLSPQIGIWTTFTPDHLSRHYTLDNYYNIKASLLERSHQQILNGDDAYLRENATDRFQDAVWTSVSGKEGLPGSRDRGAYLDGEGWVVFAGKRIIPVNLLKMVGAHNRQNLLMAVAAAKLAGIDNDAIAIAIETFPGVPHRLEFICTYAGADFINDSKATNYDAAQVGLASVKTPAILIAGGEAKAGDDTAWLKTIQTQAIKVLLIGEAAPIFAQRLQQIGYETWEVVETMENAVARAAELVELLDAAVVLLSPACASFDQYRSFEHRGEHFRQLCETLAMNNE